MTQLLEVTTVFSMLTIELKIDSFTTCIVKTYVIITLIACFACDPGVKWKQDSFCVCLYKRI